MIWALAAAGPFAAAITVVGTVTEVGQVADVAYDAGKTVVEVKDDLAAGRLDAAASKIGYMTGTVIGGVGASKVLGMAWLRRALSAQAGTMNLAPARCR